MTDPISPAPPTPPRLDHFVVGVDLSPQSLYALDLAAGLGTPHQTALTIVHVRPQPATLGFSTAAAIEYEQAEREVDASVRSHAADRLTGYSGRWQVVIRAGHVAHELLAVADETDADLVIVGHRGHGTIRDAILGSVAASTVHHSRRSVLVAIPPA